MLNFIENLTQSLVCALSLKKIIENAEIKVSKYLKSSV